MPESKAADGKRVVVVTGGGAGIGAAIAEELGRSGAFVVTVDPMVTVDGSTLLEISGQTTAERIVAAGGSARGSNISVTDRDGVRSLFRDLADEFGALDAVVNVAGITRPTGFAGGREDDWEAVLDVHLQGYLNVLGEALPIMAEAGYGRVIGVTSGSGWRPANAGAYSCAKRGVAALTWQIGHVAPKGVTVNALSPIALTRMVTSALPRSSGQQGPSPTGGGPSSGGPSSGGLNLSSMPPPEHLGPIGAYLASERFGWCSGEIIFSSGTEVAMIKAPRLLEVARTRDVTSLPHALETLVPVAFASSEANQATNGGTNPRFGAIYDESPGQSAHAQPPLARSCLIITDDEAWRTLLVEALSSRGVKCVGVGALEGGSSGSVAMARDFGAMAGQVAAASQDGPLDAIILAPVRDASSPGMVSTGTAAGSAWQQILDSHVGITEKIRSDAGWFRAASDYAADVDRAIRVVQITDACSSAGRTRAQVAAQLSRASRQATGDRVSGFAIAVETADPSDWRSAAELAVHLVCDGGADALVGAELTTGSGWIALRSHPTPAGSISYGGPAVPDWLDEVLRQLITG